MSVKRTERGWAGHFIVSNHCLFRRNTLLEKDDIALVVSTVGALVYPENNAVEEVGPGRYYETKVFFSKYDIYQDADVGRPYTDFKAEWSLDEIDDIKANEMHEKVVAEITEKLKKGEIND